MPAGHWLRIDMDGRRQEAQYWDPWQHTQPLTGCDEQEIAERVIQELRRAVELRKISDVPVGVFLSGGIDSSTNAALFAEDEPNPIKTFTIGYRGQYESYQNEMDYAQMMARQVGSEHHERLLSIDDLMEFLPEMVRLQDEPIADPVCVPVYYLSQLAKANGVTVCQVGEGADELFWGYEGWKTALNAQSYADMPFTRPLQQCAMLGLQTMKRGDSVFYEWLRRSTQGQPLFWGGAEAFNQQEKQRLIGDELKRQFRGYTSWEAIAPIRQRFLDRAWEPSNLNWMSYIDLNLRLPELLLMRVDKMAMGVSLEGRVPFLDHKFVELALSIPSEIKTRNGTLKHILKKAVRGVIPDNLIDRRKQGFGVPVYEWFFDRLGEKAKVEINHFNRQTGLLNQPYVDSLFHRGAGPQLWFLLNLAMWWKHYID